MNKSKAKNQKSNISLPEPKISPESIKPLSSHWIVGFVDGEGCFHVTINAKTKQVLPEFVVVQHSRNIHVLHAMRDFFDAGVVRKNTGARYCLRVRAIKDLATTIIPFFFANELKTDKHLDFLAFAAIVELMQDKKHLTDLGLERIRELSKKMNRQRTALLNQHLYF